MPEIQPIDAITFPPRADGDASIFIAPPYDVLTKEDKRELLLRCTRNVVAIDFPHIQPKTAGPDELYERAGQTYRRWLDQAVLHRSDKPAIYAYQQTFTLPGGDGDKTIRRRSVIANVSLQAFGDSPDGRGGVYPHEKTHSGPKEDRLKLMRATAAQLSPIFGLFSDPDDRIGPLLEAVISAKSSDVHAKTNHDSVLHELWRIDDPDQIDPFVAGLSGASIYIADGHHRYNTALNYRKQLEQAQGELPADHPANFCMFVLVSMQDPGLIVLPTHRVLGGMTGYSMEAFAQAAAGKLTVTPFAGESLSELEAALPNAGPHAIGLYDPKHQANPLAIATAVEADPLAGSHPNQSEAWRQLDVALVQHLIVEGVCQANFCPSGESVAWRFPHTLDQVKAEVDSGESQLGLVMQPVGLESIRRISEAGELMPPKSTFFYPKVATGLVIHSLEG